MIFFHFLFFPSCYVYIVPAAAAKSRQSCPTLCDPRDGSPPGSPVPGILQARTLEWVAISFSNAWKWKVKVKSLSRVRPLATPWTAAYQAPPSMDFPGKGTGVGCHCLLRKCSHSLTHFPCPLAIFLVFLVELNHNLAFHYVSIYCLISLLECEHHECRDSSLTYPGSID